MKMHRYLFACVALLGYADRWRSRRLIPPSTRSCCRSSRPGPRPTTRRPRATRASAGVRRAREARRGFHASSIPARAEALIWEGIIESSYAGAKGGLGALGLAKEARGNLEAALKIDPTALDGSAYTSLGTLYYRVPGFPVGFGDHDKARKLLQKALKINPNGIDPNYFYAEFLFEQGEYAEALQYLEKAGQGAAASRPRSGRQGTSRARSMRSWRRRRSRRR